MKRYFYYKEDKWPLGIASIRACMRLFGDDEKKMFKAKKISIPDMMFCQYYGLIIKKGQCSSKCDGYDPRNQKSGICSYHGNLYELGKEVTIKL